MVKSRVAFAALAVLLCLAMASCSRAASAEFPIVPDERLVARGKVIYDSRCVYCHGNERGEGRSHGAPPHTQQGHTWHHADRQLLQWVLDGPPMRTTMPTFRGTLSEEDARAVIAYIKTLWPEDIRRNQMEFSRQYEERIAKQNDGAR